MSLVKIFISETITKIVPVVVGINGLTIAFRDAVVSQGISGIFLGWAPLPFYEKTMSERVILISLLVSPKHKLLKSFCCKVDIKVSWAHHFFQMAHQNLIIACK